MLQSSRLQLMCVIGWQSWCMFWIQLLAPLQWLKRTYGWGGGIASLDDYGDLPKLRWCLGINGMLLILPSLFSTIRRLLWATISSCIQLMPVRSKVSINWSSSLTIAGFGGTTWLFKSKLLRELYVKLGSLILRMLLLVLVNIEIMDAIVYSSYLIA
jgi:hypothetical protein